MTIIENDPTGEAHPPELKVLVAVDDEPASHEAIEFAAQWLPSEADVTVLNVITGAVQAAFPAGFGGVASGVAVAAEHEAARLDAAAALTDAAADALGDDVETMIERGDAGMAICHVAEHHDIDVIVVGTRDRGAWSRFWLGSVSEHLARHAPCTVIIVR